jgi:hypothetical protein
MSDAKANLSRHQRMKNERQTAVETVWRDCFDLTFPLRANGINGASESQNTGQNKQAKIMDSTAADSANILASNIMAGLTPSNMCWFALDAGTESDEERRWLDDAAKLVWENIHMSNFDAEAFEGCLDMTSAGMFALYVDEDREKGGYEFQAWPLAEVYIGSTRADGRPDVVHREYSLSAAAAIREFGADKVSEKIRKADGDALFKFLHCIYPRTLESGERPVNGRMAKMLPIESCHIEVDARMEVRESGYHEMPVIIPRWLRVPSSVYPIGPIYAALPDIRQLNELKGFEIDAADIAVSGMWLGIEDGVLNPRTVKIGPRKVIVAADKDSFTPLSSGANYNLSDVMVSKLQASIRKTLMADQLQPQDGPAMTATEVHVRVEMIRKLLGPIYGRLQAEYLRPLVERCFGIAFRAGIFAPPPDSLRGRAFAVRYVSPMARAQKLDDVMAIEQVFMAAMQLAQADPTVMDELDSSKAIELIVEGRGAPGAIRRKAEDVAKLREQRAKAQAEQQQRDVMAQGAQAAAVEGGKRAGAQMIN